MVVGELAIDWLGSVDYAEALALQQERVEARRAGRVGDQIWLLEHPPVVTLGRSGDERNLLLGEAALAAKGIGVHRVSRGGDVTYHGPGQLVGYLILDLAARGQRDVHAFLRGVEAALGEALSELGVPAQTLPGYTGVFVADDRPGRPRKIASIGVGVRGWVTWHGFALNVDLDLAAFESIVPCGLDFVEMTSVARELGPDAPEDLSQRARRAVAEACRRRWS